ncbi:related to Ran-specific GTPase-activating protein 30 [Zygosaccharomyces bailii ISA1307]|nr:related to Ran-specific GTPase-activating protein 30 [Zygosaccharomyces bailii ISA1307]
MDELLSKAGSQAVTFAIRSGISIASTYAIKTITTFVTQIPKDDARRIQQLKAQLQNRVEIVSSAIDLIKLVAARGNTNLESTLKLTRDLKDELDEFDEHMRGLITQVEKSVNAKSQKDAISKVEIYIKDLLARIEEVTPFLNLSLTTSGATISSALPQQVSPGLLLQASNHLTKNNSKKVGVVGPSFQVTVFSVFYQVDKEKNGQLRVIWKEDMKRAFVKVVRATETAFKYQLEINQSFEDGRYHNVEDGEETPQSMTLDLCQITKLFFSVSGNLLKLKEQDAPVLVLKVDKNIIGRQGHDNPSVEDVMWLALGGYVEETDEDEEDEDDEDEDKEDEEDKHEDEDVKHKEKEKPSSSITLLEYLIRLASLQENDNKSILEVTDERLSTYLNDENPNSIREHNADVKVVTQEMQKVSLQS